MGPLGYLVRRPSGRYAARFQKPGGRRKMESLGQDGDVTGVLVD